MLNPKSAKNKKDNIWEATRDEPLYLNTHYNSELNDLRKSICLRKKYQKPELPVERISVCNVIENLTELGIHFLPCSYTNDV